MRVLLVNVPHPAIGSRIPDDHLTPLGLLSVGGPLIDAGHKVSLFDADLMAGRERLTSIWNWTHSGGKYGETSVEQVVAAAINFRAEAVLFGHSGSTSAHPLVSEFSRAIARALPDAWIIYGGVFPTYHWKDVLETEPQIDVVVRGEGELTCRTLMKALSDGSDLHSVPGIAFRVDNQPVETGPAEAIRNLDDFRVGWELAAKHPLGPDFKRPVRGGLGAHNAPVGRSGSQWPYSYWGGMRAAVVQFSRGCPHLCNYCGQRGFWTKWRHRDPRKFAAELAWLYREHGVELMNFADENPTVDRHAWKEFCEALVAENVPLTLVGSTRADDIVRDADLLPLYKKAGWTRFLLGMENTDEATLRLIKKGGSTSKDKEAIKLMRQNGILSMATWVAGFEEETDKDLWRGLKQILAYDPDQIQAVYVTPHRWTPFFRIAADRKVIQSERRFWDYKHQVMFTRHMEPWRLMLWVKGVELAAQARPKALARTFLQRDPGLRHAMKWYTQMGRRVWTKEIRDFFFRDIRHTNEVTLQDMWGAPQDAEERSMTLLSTIRRKGSLSQTV